MVSPPGFSLAPRQSLLHRAAARLRGKRPECRAAPFAVLSAALVVLLNNSRLFALAGEHADLASLAGLACILTIYLALTGMLALFFLIVGYRWTMKPAVITGFMLSAALAYFTREFGTVFDGVMIRNILEAFHDRNTLEASELLSTALAAHLTLFGVLPSVLALTVRVSYGTRRQELISRSLYAGGLAAVSALLILGNFRYLTYFSREHFSLRCYATPTYAINNLIKYSAKAWFGKPAPFEELGADAVHRKSGSQRTIGILVVGETARADHFSLNGYSRKTNPRLEVRKLLNFPDVRASGTSTAYSVPYMFSFLGKRAFTPDKASLQSNALDVLSRAGVTVVWIENNSGPKGVCDRIGYVNLRDKADASSPLYSDGGYYDEVLVGEVQRHIGSTTADILLVLHTMGSHGPAYHRRYPAAFEVFTPACKEGTPQRSRLEEVTNAYDNTILYTDSVLDRLIALLEGRGDSDCSFLIYVSDHGESLGENGIYLHGLPEFLAPSAQTQVPMFAWLSTSLLAGQGLDFAKLQAHTAAHHSHDNIPHSLLGLFQVQTALYRADLNPYRPD